MKNKKIWIILGVLVIIGILIVSIVLTQKPGQKEEQAIKIGAILPLTGSAGLHAEFQKNGIELAVEEINKANGIKGIPIKMVYGDSKNEAKEGIGLFTNFTEIKKIPIILSSLSGVSVPMASYVETQKGQLNTVLLVTIVSAPGIAAKSPNVFRFWITSDRESQILANFAIENLKMKKMGIYYVNDEYGLGAFKSFNEVLKLKGMDVVWSEIFSPGQTDHRNALAKLIGTDLDGILIAGYDKAFATSIKQLREVGVKVQLLTTLGLSVKEWRDLCGESVENAYFTTSMFDVELYSEKNNFDTNFFSKYGKHPNIISAACYTSIYLIAQAIKEGGYSVDGIKRGLLSIKNFPTPVGSISFDEQGEASPTVTIRQIKNGQIVKPD